jgi:hypothetical protein
LAGWVLGKQAAWVGAVNEAVAVVIYEVVAELRAGWVSGASEVGTIDEAVVVIVEVISAVLLARGVKGAALIGAIDEAIVVIVESVGAVLLAGGIKAAVVCIGAVSEAIIVVIGVVVAVAYFEEELAVLIAGKAIGWVALFRGSDLGIAADNTLAVDQVSDALRVGAVDEAVVVIVLTVTTAFGAGCVSDAFLIFAVSEAIAVIVLGVTAEASLGYELAVVITGGGGRWVAGFNGVYDIIAAGFDGAVVTAAVARAVVAIVAGLVCVEDAIAAAGAGSGEAVVLAAVPR